MGKRALGRLLYCTTKSSLYARTQHHSWLSACSANRAFDKNHSKPGILPWLLHARFHAPAVYMQKHVDSSSTGTGPINEIRVNLSDEERRRLLKLVDMEDLKKRLRNSGQDCMPYVSVTKLLQETGMAATNVEADAVLQSLDDAGMVLILRNVVFVRPDKIAELIANVLPLSVAKENDPRREELKNLEKEKEDIDKAAQNQVRHMLWAAFGVLSLQSLLFFRLTFWDLSWDVMEPITFFVTSSTVLAGLLFFICTSREPSYQDLMHTLFSIKQQKLMKKKNFNAQRLKQLQTMHSCMSPTHDYQ